MSFLSNLIPINLLEEKEKFLNDHKYNPQFVYDEPIDHKKLSQYGAPKQPYLDLAKAILEKSYFGRNELDLFMMEGKELNQQEVTDKTRTFLEMHGLSERFAIVWSSSFVSRATINEDTVKYRLPVDYRKEGLIGALYHEIGTHALRRINYEQQPWFKKKKKYGFADYLRTEEGLASLHSLLPHSFKSAYISAIRYLAVNVAQSASFAEVWHSLDQYVEDIERRWMITIRQKRGLEDTSQPGGYTKDLVYFEGLVDVWQWLTKNNYDLETLYFGKLAAEDIDKARELNPIFQPLLPVFFQEKDKYIQAVSEIGEYNEFNNL